MLTRRSRLSRLALAASLGAGVVALLAAPAAAEPGFTNILTMPAPLGVAGAGDAYTQVSCASTYVCTAIGSFEEDSRLSVVTEQGRRWHAPVALLPPIGAVAAGPNGPRISSISCPAVHACMAVGDYHEASGAMLPLLYQESAGAWSIPNTVAVPSNADTGTLEQAQLTAVDCTVAGTCVAVGNYRGTDGVAHQFSTSWVAYVGSAPVQLPDFSGIATGGQASITSVSCTDADDCTALGRASSSSSFFAQPATWREVAGTWSYTGVIPTGKSSEYLALSLSCPTTTTCVTVGALFGPDAITPGYAVETSRTWGVARALPLPGLAPGIDLGVLESVSCTAASVCEAVGLFEGYSSGLTNLAGAYTWSAGRWSSGGLVRGVRAGPVAANRTAFLSVSCPTTSWCSAIGEDEAVAKSGRLGPVHAFSSALVPARATSTPSPPIAVSARGVSGGIEVSWAPPSNDGGSPIREYDVRLLGARGSCTTTGRLCSFGHLRNGHRYRVTVADRTAVGWSPRSAVASVLAGTAPTAPTGVHLTFHGDQLVVTWRPSRSPFGEPARYRVQVLGPKRFDRVAVTRGHRASFTIAWTGAYTVRLRAWNASGASPRVVVTGTPVDPIPAGAPRP